MTNGSKFVSFFVMMPFLTLFLIMAAQTGHAADAPAKENKVLDRVMEAEKNSMKWLGKSGDALTLTDPDLALIKDRLIYGQILGQGSLSEKQQALIILATLTATQGLEELEVQVESALRIGTDPVEIKEAIYQCSPYAGFPKVEAALAVVNKVFKQNDIATPLPGQGTVEEKSRFADGLKVQKGIFGDRIQQMHDNAPAGQKNLVVDYLTAYCFGDFYTRKTLDLKMRELIVFTVINSIGGCESQAKGHTQGNIKVGNTKQNLVDAIAVMLPFIGFPRSLNALAVVNEVCPEDSGKAAGSADDKNSGKSSGDGTGKKDEKK